ncbi:uncharacterized protein Atf-2 [Lepeophtheirus salmonis]|uniref:uncharacterized protein Atf-2 n=1 Tax=Lepeophtheirus salmonis TaxID=72036 RepID=UPI001AE93764|nr:uncharacterized protein LOC121122604 [Lepeophtheirus salmonis]
MPKRPSVTIPSTTPKLLDTPTPTKLLEAVDEAGVFQDLSESPFDRDFRKATKNEEEVLNTPQILPPTPIEKTSRVTPVKTGLKPIAPKDSNAQLILKLPTGPSFFLSNLPFALQDPLKPESNPHLPTKLSRAEDVRERNRFAAIRSRERKRKKIEYELDKSKKLQQFNTSLVQENESLKRKLQELETALTNKICKFCSSRLKDTHVSK